MGATDQPKTTRGRRFVHDTCEAVLRGESSDPQQTEQALRERVKELRCLYAVSALTREMPLSLEGLLQGTIEALLPAYQFPEVTCVRISLEGREYVSDGFQSSPWCQTADMAPDGGAVGRIEVFYREPRPEADEGPFLREERDLIEAVARLLSGRISEVREREAREALRESEGRLRRQADELEAFYQSAPVGLAVVDSELRYLRINRHLADINGLPVEAHLGRRVQEVLPALAAEVVPRMRRVLETGESLRDIETSGETAAQPGVLRHWIEHYHPLRDETGRVAGIHVVTEEVTERKRMEAVRRREYEFRSLAENLPDVVVRFDRELRCVYANPSIELYLGAPRQSMVGRFASGLNISATLAGQCEHALTSVIAAGQPQLLEFSLPTPLGERIFEAQVVPEFASDGSVDTVLVISHDISDRIRDERALQASEKKYRELVEYLYEGIWLIDPHGVTTFVNARMAQMLGYGVDDMVGKHLFAFMTDSEIELARRKLKDRRDGIHEAHEFTFRRKDGSAIVTRMATAPVFDPDGQYRGALAAVMDFTDRKRAEEALHRREQEFRALAERSPDAVCRFNSELRHTYANPAVEKLMGRSPYRLIGSAMGDLDFPREVVQTWERHLRAVFAGGKEAELEFSCPDTPSGDRFYDTRLVPEFGPVGQVESVIAVTREITRRKRAEGELLRLNRRLEERDATLRRANAELQQFASAVAHDLKAPLRAVRALSTWIEEELGARLPGKAEALIRLLHARVAHMDELITGLLDYSRAGGQIGRVETVSTTALVQEVLGTCGLPDGFTVALSPELPVLQTARMPLQQVLANLVDNAVKHHDRDDGHIGVTVRDAGEWFEFTVADDGPGIPADEQESIFEMLRRGAGAERVSGTGIGLAMVKRVVENVGGHVWVESAPGEGATFRFTWPKHMVVNGATGK